MRCTYLSLSQSLSVHRGDYGVIHTGAVLGPRIMVRVLKSLRCGMHDDTCCIVTCPVLILLFMPRPKSVRHHPSALHPPVLTALRPAEPFRSSDVSLCPDPPNIAYECPRLHIEVILAGLLVDSYAWGFSLMAHSSKL
jgi:hypothetical protein